MDLLIKYMVETGVDHCSFNGPIPIGSTAEVAKAEAIIKANGEAQEPVHCEHVTTVIHGSPEMFRVERIEPPQYLKGRGYRLTLDTKEDLNLLRVVHGSLTGASLPFDCKNAVELLDRESKLIEANRAVEHKNWKDNL